MALRLLLATAILTVTLSFLTGHVPTLTVTTSRSNDTTIHTVELGASQSETIFHFPALTVTTCRSNDTTIHTVEFGASQSEAIFQYQRELSEANEAVRGLANQSIISRDKAGKLREKLVESRDDQEALIQDLVSCRRQLAEEERQTPLPNLQTCSVPPPKYSLH